MPRDQVGSEGNGAILTILTIDDLHDYVDGVASDDVGQAIEALYEDDPRVKRWAREYRQKTARMSQ